MHNDLLDAVTTTAGGRWIRLGRRAKSDFAAVLWTILGGGLRHGGSLSDSAKTTEGPRQPLTSSHASDWLTCGQGPRLITMRTWLFPGSFDPPTYAHLDIAQRAAALCDRLYIGIGINSAKQLLLEPEQRQAVWQELLAEAGLTDQTEIHIYRNATAYLAQRLDCRVILRVYAVNAIGLGLGGIGARQSTTCGLSWY